MDDITKQIFLEKIRVSIDDYKSHADELFRIINIHFKNESDRLKNIAILCFQRYYSGLISISTLISQYKFYKQIEFTYAIILRSLLLDFITVEYLRAQQKIGSEEFNKGLERINYLTAENSNRFCDNLKIDKDGFRNYISENLFPENFKRDENTGNYKLKKIKSLSPWEMADYFKGKQEPFAFDAYELYSHYSLIEHFNNLTYISMQGENASDVNKMGWTMFYVFQGHYRCLEILDFFPKYSSEIIDKRKYFLDLINELTEK